MKGCQTQRAMQKDTLWGKIQEFDTEHFKFEMLERVSMEILSKVISSHLRSFEKSVYIRLLLVDEGYVKMRDVHQNYLLEPI